MQLTPAWKARVLQALKANERAGRSPDSPAALARAIGADKSGLNKMLVGDQPSYKYAKQICEVLGIDEPMVPNPAIVEDDEWDRAVAAARALPLEQQRKFLRALKALVFDDKS